MAVDGKSDEDIRRILSEARTIAMVGASPNPARPSNGVLAFLLRRGYAVTPVNPGHAGKTIHGATVVGKLSDLPGPVDIVDVFRNSEAAGGTIDEVLALPWKPKAIWLQLGVVNEPAAARARAAGIPVVMNRCPKIEIPRLRM
jgi:predicted CoA-binding protein